MRILIVEDERRLAEALGQIMAEQRYQADVVFDGADGLDYALTGQYDAIVLDVMLPKVGGFEVARRLRCAHVSTPILTVSYTHLVAQGDADEAAQSTQDGGLHQELPHDLPPGRADGLLDADFPGPLRDGDQHDVHDTDSAHQQGDARDAAQYHRCV